MGPEGKPSFSDRAAGLGWQRPPPLGERMGAGCSARDVRQQPHIRNATLDSLDRGVIEHRVGSNSGHQQVASAREYSSTTGRPPGALLHAVALRLRVRVHGGCAQKGCALDSGFGGHTKMVLVLEGVREHADLEQEQTMHSSKSFLTLQCDFLQQEEVRHDAKHDQHPHGLRQEAVPARCVESHCGESGALEGLSWGDSNPRRVKCRRGQPSLCLWARVPVLGPGAVPAQRAGRHSGETLWWGVARGSQGDPRCVKCHRGQPRLCLGVIKSVLRPGAAVAQSVQYHCGARQGEGDLRRAKCHCGENLWWGLPGQSEGESLRVKCHRQKSVLCPWAAGPVLGSDAVLEQCVKRHCGETCWWGVPRQSEGDSRCVKCLRGQPLLYLGVTRQVLRPAAAFAQSVKRHCGQSLGAVRQEHAAMSTQKVWTKEALKRMEEQRKSEMPGMLVAKQKATQNARDGEAARAAQNKEARQLREAEEVRTVQESLQMLSLNLQWSAAAQAWGADGGLLKKISACARQMGVGFKRDDAQGVVLMVATALTAGKGLRAVAIRALETNTGPPYALWLQHPIQGREFDLIFKADSTLGDRGSAGLKYVALAGYVSEPGGNGAQQGSKRNKKK
jgi:hypothetical protein